MIDTGLDRSYKPQAGQEQNFDPIPKGEYEFTVTEIKPWVEAKKTIKVIQRDEDGKALVDAKGDKVTETVKDCIFYNAQVILEVDKGEYLGRRLFHSITTHPNMPFSIPAFLHGVGLSEIKASQIQELAVGKRGIASVDIDTYDKKVTDRETGIETTVEKEINRVKNFKPLAEPTEEIAEDDDVPF
jgi:hypothetical protein